MKKQLLAALIICAFSQSSMANIFGQFPTPNLFFQPPNPKPPLFINFIPVVVVNPGEVLPPVSNETIERLVNEYNLPQRSSEIESEVNSEISYCFEKTKEEYTRLTETRDIHVAETHVASVRSRVHKSSERSYDDFGKCVKSKTKLYVDKSDSDKRSQCSSGDFAVCQTAYFTKSVGFCERAYLNSYKKIFTECIKNKIDTTVKKHKSKKRKRK